MITDYHYFEKDIDNFSDSCIKDREIIQFINNIRYPYLKKIVRLNFEYVISTINMHYSLNDFKQDFIDYLNLDDKSNYNYFMEGSNEHCEDILRYLLKIKKEGNKYVFK